MKHLFKIIFVLLAFTATAQEYTAPLKGNINLIYSQTGKAIPPKNYLDKTQAAGDTIFIPLFEDFSYAPTSAYPSGKIWMDSSVYVNTGFAFAPMSIGVATFDGLNKNGYPYNISAQPIVSAAADTLTSKPIALGNKGMYFYQPSDSVAISFFYQRQGFGENPEVNDSLILEFYKPRQGKWAQAWATRGNNSPLSNDSTHKHGFVRIKDTAYYHNGFRLRFRNKATSSGSVDHWHLDYIQMDMNLLKSDTTFDDLAFGYVPRPPMLKNYSSMPWWQFTAADKDTSFSNFIRYNGDSLSSENVRYRYNMYNSSGSPVYSKDLGSNTLKSFYPNGWDKDAKHRDPGITYTVSSLSDSTRFIFKHYVDQVDNWTGNDTVYQKLEFNNYYAYDDGSAERGYYHNAYGAKDALKFTLNFPDTLRALDIFFDPIIDVDKIQLSSFRIHVWSDGGGQPGAVVWKDSTMKPVYHKFGHNQFPRYFITGGGLPLGAATYYIGIQQITNQALNIGFDVNLDNHTKLYYDVSGSWVQSSVKGSLMMHPVFGNSARALVGIQEEPLRQKDNLILVYPNPANDKLFISSTVLNPKDDFSIELYSVLGTKLNETRVEHSTTEISLNDYAAGIYFVALKQNGQTISYKKFIIAR